ncbi:Cache 3/Cache 2 fusion domain-containing protein [Ferrimonas sp.]|uniref:methyl-accepting chemotaxis protein n=1 Tax=Ferrimonas sp. TaxID=2080861 RepID=UPI003A93F87C
MVTLSFSGTAYFVYQDAYQALLKTTLTEHESKVKALSLTMEQSFSGYLKQAEVLTSTLRNQYMKGVTINPSPKLLSGKQVTDFLVSGVEVSNNQMVDQFAKDSQAGATIFSKDGSDYIRLSTSFTNPQGERIVGTPLQRNSPAYQTLQRGEDYYNKTNVQGKSYLAYYSPLRNEQGIVIGAVAVALLVDQAANDLFSSLSRIQWGDTGYTIVFDDSEANRGMYLHHPLKENLSKNIISLATEEKPFQKLFDGESGVVHYPHTYNGFTGEKYLAFAKVPGWEWVLTGGTFIDEITKGSRAALYQIVTIALIAGLATIVFVTWALKRVLSPLTAANDYMRALGDGQVSVRIPVPSHNADNEITNLVGNMGGMAANLRKTIESIKSNITESRASADSVAQFSENSLKQTEQQQHQVDQMATAIEEMASSANSVAEQVESMANNVREADADSEQGSILMDNVEQEVAQLTQQLSQSTEAIQQVHEESKNIESVTTMIDTIADQTNLLALNAAIEAARAGEHGRGFSVVADEVRQLAHRTQSSVQEVIGIIGQLQSRIQSSVNMMNAGQESSQQVNDKVKSAGGAFRDIRTQVQSIASMAEGIAATSEQQAQVSQEISSNASQVSEITHMTKDAAVQTANRAEELHRLAENLSQQMEHFH